MFNLSGPSDKNVLPALNKALAIIEFDPSGRILTANTNFCAVMGYDLAEIVDKHHSMFVDPDHARGPDYKEFWERLGRGEFEAKEYRRLAKGNRDVWIQASYNPVLNARGKIIKIVKVATDVTEAKLQSVEAQAKLEAISRVQGVIEFTVDGSVITANENFLNVLGYRLDEIKGKHHRMFVESSYAHSAEYQEFWEALRRGGFISAEFKRVGKGGKEVWIQASYNPVFDLKNQVSKVIKFATEITDRVFAVKEIGLGLSKLARNDLQQRIETSFTPTFEALRSDFNLSLENLQSIMLEVVHSTDAIHSGAREITIAADDLSRRTENQAANLEETAGALNLITTTVKSAADGAAHARDVVVAADEDARASAIVVRQTVDAMDAIAKSAQQISQIIGVIDEIAFQTNLLALNAGVEAARAGDAGRGFAVVASEVRALAQRSAEAAKEIKALISASTKHVDHGVKLVAETGRSLDRISKQVNEISGVVSNIATGSKEQATGLTEINSAINQMDQVTQQNAAMVEETTAASHALSGEATKLADLIGRFDVGQPKDDLRKELAKSVPHAFEKSNATARPTASRPLKVVAKVVNGSSSGSQGWGGF